jgi:hypothetical protein
MVLDITKCINIVSPKENLPFSGLGDRLGFYLGLSTLGKVLNKKVITGWNKRMDHIGDDSTELFNLIKFPDNLVFVDVDELEKYGSKPENYLMYDYSKFNYGNDFIKYHGVDQVPELLWKMFYLMNINIPKDLFVKTFIELGKEIEFVQSDFVKRMLNHNVLKNQKYIVIHARRGDKNTNGILIDSETLDKITKISKYLNEKSLLDEIKVIVCSDSEPTSKMLIRYLQQVNIKVIVLPKAKKMYDSLILDFELIKNSIGIIQSIGDIPGYYAGWSSFSAIPGFIYDIPVYSVYPVNKLGEYRYHLYKKLNDNVDIKNYYYYDMLIEYLEKIIH